MHFAPRAIAPGLVDDLSAIVWEADPRTFQFTYVSRGAEALLGYSLEDWLSRPTFWVDLLHPDDREAAVKACLTAVADGRDHDFEYRVVRADGSVRWLRDIVSVVCDAGGRAERLCGLMIDVTATRAEALRDQSDRYRRVIVEHGLDVAVITDASGAILFESPSVETVLGLAPGAGQGRNIFEMVHPDDAGRMKSLFATAFSSGATRTPFQLRYQHGDGSWRLLEALGRRIEDANGVMVVINARDVTDRVRLEEEFRQAQKMEALARITSAVAHDFNNLLTVIRGNVELAIEDAASGVHRELLEIRKAAEVASAMVAQLLTFGGQQRRAVVVDVNETLQTLRTILERVLGPVAVLSVNAEARQPRVHMEGGALEQVLINLVVNAREAMVVTGRVDITTRNVRGAGHGGSATPTRDFIEIEVADTGSGMTPQIRDRIFELYFTTKDGTRGTGHGLATVYAIVRDAGGTITVDTEPGKGTTFRIRVPLMPTSPTSPS